MTWQKRTGKPLAPELIEKYHLSDLTATLFANRGLNTDQKLAFWLQATEEDLADPFLMHDMKKAVDRINKAIDAGEKITIYGDYDADGITATTIMVDTLSILGSDVHYFLPDRFQEGYGPSLKNYQKLVADGTKLIITVDNGITGCEEVDYAASHGVDVIVTDHHLMPSVLPKAIAILHSDWPKQKYPFKDYAGCGVAYTLCRALMSDSMPELLELALIGTIGDMMSLRGENHIIVKRGLALLNQSTRPGLRALIHESGLSMGNVTLDDIGFAIAPRLNAAGRLADARLAVELLLTDDEKEAQKLAKQLEALNTQRQRLTAKITKEAIQQVKLKGWQSEDTLVLYDPDWHEGILGLVANRVASKLKKPTIMLTKNEAGKIKGSVRSFGGFNVYQALVKLNGNILTQFGGHDFAAGLSLEPDKISALRHAFTIKGQNINHEADDESEYDLSLKGAWLNFETLTQISAVGPFGPDQPVPVFSVSAPKINRWRFLGQTKEHVGFEIDCDGIKLSVVGFYKSFFKPSLFPFISKLYVTLGMNQWRGHQKLQATLIGADFSAPESKPDRTIFDLRPISKILDVADRYLVFTPEGKEKAVQIWQISPEKIVIAGDGTVPSEAKVTLLERPLNSQQLQQTVQQDYLQLYLHFLLTGLPITKIPPKVKFAQTLKYVLAHPTLKKSDYELVAPYLDLMPASLYFILRVFLELKFVKMDNALLVPTPHMPHRSLTDSQYLMATASQLAFGNKLLKMPSQQLLDYVESLKR